MGSLETVLTVGRMMMVSKVLISGSANAAYSLNLKGDALCKDKIAYSRMANNSEALPKFTHFSVYRTTDYTLINRHRLRITNSQPISFRVKRGVDAGDESVICADPDWQKRDFQLNTGNVGTR